MRPEQRVIIRFLLKEKVHPTQIHKRLATQYGLETHSLGSVQYWCQLFDCGRQNLHDGPRSGRPPIDHLDAKIISCLERELLFSLVIVLNHLHSFAQFAGSQKISSSLGPTAVDRGPTAGEGRKMR
jgi:hypothetical protein